MRLTLFKTKDCILNSLFKCKRDFVCKVFEISSCVLKSTVFLSLSLVGIQYSNIQCCKNISIWANLLACFSCVKRRRKYSFVLNFKTKHMVTPRNISNQAVFKLIKLSTHTHLLLRACAAHQYIHSKYNLFSIGERCELLGRLSFLLPTSKNESSWHLTDDNLNVKRHLYAFYAPEIAVWTKLGSQYSLGSGDFAVSGQQPTVGRNRSWLLSLNSHLYHSQM